MNELMIPEDEIQHWDELVREGSPKPWVGTLLKYNKGDYYAGPDDKNAIPLGTRVVCVMPSMLKGWVKWEAGKPIIHEMGLVVKGFVPAARNDLGDNDKKMWERDNRGDPKDPWQYNIYVVMIDVKTEQVFTFTTSSKGGRGAIGELAKIYGKNLRMFPGKLPVVELDTGSYKHTDYGRVATPSFKVVDWVDGADWLALVDADVNGEQPAKKQITTKPSEASPKKKGSNIKFDQNYSK
jgi:hypothetical protein